MRNWQRGVGIRDAKMPTNSLFMYDGYRKDCILAAMTVDTNWLVWSKDGVWTCSLSAHIRARAILSKTITESAWSTSRFSVINELYGCTTTSLSWVFGNTLVYVWMIFLGNLSFNRSKKKGTKARSRSSSYEVYSDENLKIWWKCDAPKCSIPHTSKESLLRVSGSLSIISVTSPYICSPAA